MNKQEILEKVGEILCDESIIDDTSTLTLETDFKNDLNMDSLEMINLITIFEDEFDISIDDNILSSIIKVEDAVRVIESMLEEK
jgi:acyl carrier protein